MASVPQGCQGSAPRARYYHWTPSLSMYRRLLKGDALAQFNAAATNMTESMANLTLVLQQVTTHVFPDKALVKQRVYMNRYLRKTMQVKMRQYMAR